MFIVPIEERALEAYEGGYRKAIELRMFNRWTQKLREGLTRLNEVEYPPLREIGVEMAKDRLLPMPQPYAALMRDDQGKPAAAADRAPAAGAANEPPRGAKPKTKPGVDAAPRPGAASVKRKSAVRGGKR